MKNAIDTLKAAVRSNDPVLAGRAVDSLRVKGYTYRDCYRVALAANPELSSDEWEDLMARADESETL